MAVVRRQEGRGSARNLARAPLNWASQGQRWGRCKVRRRAERVSLPAMEKKRRRRVLVVTICSPRPMRAVQRARLWAITCTASQAPFGRLRIGGEAARGEMVQPHAVLEVSDGVLDLGVGLNHLPSGRFAANGVWLAVQVMAHNLVWYVGMRQTDPTSVEENRGPAWSSHPILIEPEQLPGPIAPASCKEGPTRKGRRSHRRYRWKENRWKENRDS